MKKILILLLLPLYLFSQESNTVGDVDCNGQINSEDASLILQYVANIIDTLPCQNNMNGLTPEQLQEIIDMMENQISINYGGAMFGDWLLKYDSPDSDIIYGQEEADGFLLVKYSRSGGSNSSSSFGFNIHTGTTLDTINFDMDITINIKSGWSPIDSKLVPIKKSEYWVIEAGEVYSTEAEIHQVYFLPINNQFNAFENTSTNTNDENNGVAYDMIFPDGYAGDPISWSCINDGIYVVPEGKNLYITQYFGESSSELTIDDIVLSYSYSNNLFYTGVGWAPSLTNGMPFVAGENQEINGGNFNGFLVNAIVSPITSDVDEYIVPDGKRLYITQYFGESSSELIIDNVVISSSYSNNLFYTGVGWTPSITFSMPVIVGEGQIVSGGGHINGYLVGGDYFSSGGDASLDSSNSGENYIVLNSDQYIFNPDFSIFPSSLTVEITDVNILNSYLMNGITCRIYDSVGVLLVDSPASFHPTELLSYSFGSAVIENQQSGDTINIQLAFMSSLGMIVIDETITIP